MTKRNKILKSFAAGFIALAPIVGCVSENNSEITSDQKEQGFYWTMNKTTTNSPSDTIIVTTSKIPKNPELQDAISDYARTLYQTNGLTTNYVELDSEECSAIFGVNSRNIGEEKTLDTIIESTKPRYIILLGNEGIVPRPKRIFNLDGKVKSVPSDSWYCDANKDNIIDDGISIGRIDNYTGQTDAIVVALKTATNIHDSGGLTIEKKVNAGMPRANYGICKECIEQDQFIYDASQTDLLSFTGHGSPSGFYQGQGPYEFRNILLANDIKMLNLSKNNPLILAFGPCSTAADIPDSYVDGLSARLPVEFLKAGAAGFIGNTVAEGYSTKFKHEFDISLKNGSTLGEALSNAARKTSLENPELIISTHQYQLYGDPSIKVVDLTK